MNKKLKLLLAAVLLCLISAAAWYFLYWIRTPQYSLGLIRESIASHNFESLQKHADLESLYSHGYDDMAAEMPENLRNNPLASVIVKSLKGRIISQLIDETGKNFNAAANQKELTKEEQASGDFSNLLKNRVGAAAISMTDIVSVTRNGDEATADIRIHDKNLNRDFIWKIRMVPNSDGSWKAVQIMNLREYLEERSAAQGRADSMKVPGK